MDFGSKYVFNYSDSEEEVVSDDEMEMGLQAWNASDDDPRTTNDGGVALPQMPLLPGMNRSNHPTHTHPRLAGSLPPPLPPPNQHSKHKKKKKYTNKQKPHHHWETDGSSPRQQQGKRQRRADTNILSIKFGQLTKSSNMHTGDANSCSQCGALVSHLSQLTEHGQSKMWVCEFCSQRNQLDIEPEEVPQRDDVTYMVSPACTTTPGGNRGRDDGLVIFCVDTSGSMCVTTEVVGTVRLRGDRLSQLQALNTEGRSQYLPSQRRDVTFVSRLQGVQAAVDNQLCEMSKDHPHRRVGLITFSSEVHVVGDGSRDTRHYSGDKLYNREEILAAGKSLPLPHHIENWHTILSNRVYELEEGGQTALGPALLLAVSMATQVPGSKVIMCTDGMANVGLGSLDGVSEAQYVNVSTFYQELTQLATDNGVSVSVITIKGTDCKLAELGQVASNTGGQVNIVDPLKLTEEFSNILADATIATNVNATLIIHSGLYFRSEENTGSKKSQQIGNVTRDTEITFEFGVRKQSKKEKSTDWTLR